MINRSKYTVIALMTSSALFMSTSFAYAEGSAVNLQSEIDKCLSKTIASDLSGVKKQRESCFKLSADIEKMKTSRSIDKGITAEAVDLDNLKKLSDGKSESLTKDLPSLSLGDSNWSLTIPVFVGFIKAQFVDDGSDNFQFLNGLGSGVKFRYSGVMENGDISEIVGFSVGFYLEKTDQDEDEDTTFAMSPILVASTLEHFNVGLGYTLLSSAGGFKRSDLYNFFILIGVGADGETFIGK
jgi:hypothetical protein